MLIPKFARDNKEVMAAISERSEGDQRNLQSGAAKKWLHSLGINQNQVVRAEQVRRNKIAVVGKGDTGKKISGVDGLVTNVPGVYLGIIAADCEQILIFDPIQKVVAAIHAGWRGNVSGIIPRAVSALNENFTCQSKDLLIYIGPSLGPCHARFSDPEKELPPEFHKYIVRRENKAGWLDFWQATWDQLITLGVRANHIENAKVCTVCQNGKYFSYRAEQKLIGEQLGLIGLKSK